MIHHRRVHLEEARDRSGLRGEDPFAPEVVVALHQDVGLEPVDEPGHLGPGAKAEEAVRRRPADAVDRIPVARGIAQALVLRHGVDLMPSLRKLPRDLMHMDAAARFPGKLLVRRDVQNPHQTGESTPKNGPVRTLPKSATSSIRTWVRPRARRRAEAEGAGLPTM